MYTIYTVIIIKEDCLFLDILTVPYSTVITKNSWLGIIGENLRITIFKKKKLFLEKLGNKLKPSQKNKRFLKNYKLSNK